MKIKTYVRTSRAPMPFGALHPGSTFSIHAEKSRGLNYSRDMSIYKKARSEEGFYAYDSQEVTRVACLYPDDLVWPLAEKRN